MMASGSSYWCFRCNMFVRVRLRNSVSCVHCGDGFVEEINAHDRSPAPPEMHVGDSASLDRGPIPRVRRNWRSGHDRSVFNPVIVLRGPAEGNAGDGGERRNYELYYDEGDGSGLRPLPASMSEFLMVSGLDRLLDHLAQLENSGVGLLDPPAASKAAIESMPTIRIVTSHVVTDSHCAVCKEQFELDMEAREMPCKHIYHSDCILPWLSIRNSCPVCRHELPSEVRSSGMSSPGSEQSPGLNYDAIVGLTIWRLPGGGFAVGRFSGGRQAAEHELPIVYTEMDGGLNAGGPPRRSAGATYGSRARERSRMRRALGNFFSLFRRLRFSSSRFSLEIGFRRSRTHSGFDNRSSRRHSHRSTMDDSAVPRG